PGPPSLTHHRGPKGGPMPPPHDDPFAAVERLAAGQAAAERAAKALAAARARLILGRDAKSAFFACLALRLAPRADPTVPTMATDGQELVYGPEFVDGLPADELLGG